MGLDQKSREALDPKGPYAAASGGGNLAVIAVTTSSQAIDLTGANYACIYNAAIAGRVITLRADGAKVWYRWGSATGTADQTAVAGSANQTSVLADGERSDESPPKGCCAWLMIKGSAAGYIRLHASSMSDAAFVGV